MRGLAFALLLLANLAQARPVQAEPLGGECFSHAAQTYGVNAKVLMAIAWHESHFLPWRMHRNSDGSTDYGVMQVNSRNLPALGLTTQTVMQPCTHILAAARLYGRAVRRYGNTWAAVGVYHSTTPALQQRYAQDIQQNFNVITRINAWWGKLCGWFAGLPAWWLGRPFPQTEFSPESSKNPICEPCWRLPSFCPSIVADANYYTTFEVLP